MGGFGSLQTMPQERDQWIVALHACVKEILSLVSE